MKLKMMFVILFATSMALAQTYNSSLTGAYVDSAAVNATWNARGIFNVLKYGADPTGVTNSRVAIQAAIDAAFSTNSSTAHAASSSDATGWKGGATIYFPPGTYLVQGTLNCTMSRGSIFTASANKTTKIVFDTDGTPGWDFTGSGDMQMWNLAMECVTGTHAPNYFIVLARDSNTVTGTLGAYSGWNKFYNNIIYGPTSGTTCKGLVLNISDETDEWYGNRFVSQTNGVTVFEFTSVNDMNFQSAFVANMQHGYESGSTMVWTGGTLGVWSDTDWNTSIPLKLHNVQAVTFNGLWLASRSLRQVELLGDASAHSLLAINFFGCRFESYWSQSPKYVFNITLTANQGGCTAFNAIGCAGAADSAWINIDGGVNTTCYFGTIGGNIIEAPTPFAIRQTGTGLIRADHIDASGSALSLGSVYGGIMASNVGSNRRTAIFGFPTSASGLNSGELWLNNNVLTIVP